MAIPFEFIRGLKERAPTVVMVEIPDHPDGPVYVWSGIGPLEYGGVTYIGAGALGAVQSSRKGIELRIDEVTLTVSGVDPSIAGEVSDQIRNIEADVYLAVLHPNGKVRSRMLIDNILLDHMRDSLGDDGSAMISLVGEAGLWQLQRTTDEVWSDANQQLKFPGDTGLSFIAAMRNKQTNWTKD